MFIVREMFKMSCAIAFCVYFNALLDIALFHVAGKQLTQRIGGTITMEQLCNMRS